MVNMAKAMELLKKLGLNSYEASAYLALVKVKSATASKLSELAHIPRPRVYDVLEKLEQKGLVKIIPQRPIRYEAIPIKKAIEHLKRKRMEEFKKEISELDAIGDELARELKEEGKEKISSGEVYYLADRRNIYNTIRTLVENANNHIIIGGDEIGLARKLEYMGDVIESAKSRGVMFKAIKGDHRFAIVDNEVILFLNNPKDPRLDRAAWIRSPMVAEMIKKNLGIRV